MDKTGTTQLRVYFNLDDNDDMFKALSDRYSLSGSLMVNGSFEDPVIGRSPARRALLRKESA